MSRALSPSALIPDRRLADDLLEFVRGGGTITKFKEERGVSQARVDRLRRTVDGFAMDMGDARRSRAGVIRERVVENVIGPASRMELADLETEGSARVVGSALKLQKMADREVEVSQSHGDGAHVEINLHIKEKDLQILQQIMTPIVKDGYPVNPNEAVMEAHYREVEKNEREKRGFEKVEAQNRAPGRRVPRPRPGNAEDPQRA